MYFLLEHHPLKIYLQTYQNKYGGNPSMASYALLHHDNIDMEVKVKMLQGKESDLKNINERLKKAVHNPMFKFGERPNLPKKGRVFRR
jgi:hypothetical protein